MTEGPPPSQASGSGTVSTGSHLDSGKTTLPLYSNTTVPTPNALPSAPPLSYGNYSAWNNAWSSNYSGYAAMTANPALYGHMHPYTNLMAGYGPQMMTIQSNSYNPYSHLASKINSEQSTTFSTKVSHSTPMSSTPVGVATPSLSEIEGCRHWDEVFRRFLEKTKMTQCLKGFEIDMLVLNSEWEQKIVPDALKELVDGMQLILDRLTGKAKQAEEVPQGVTETSAVLQEQQQLDERKLDYIRLSDGTKPKPPSSINKSISQFLARSRARNDASNRAEFLHSLAEKKRKFLEGTTSSSLSEPALPSITMDVKELTSCARVDAKPIDRDKQIKYDIAKNEAGPLTRTRVVNNPPSDSIDVPSISAVESTLQSPTPGSPPTLRPLAPLENSFPQPHKKRRLCNIEEDRVDISVSAGRISSKGKGKAKEKPVPSTIAHSDDVEGDCIPEALLASTEERVTNLEEHLSIRYVPSQPQTLLSRLKYLEDHLIRLEKEYPPWAALHFNQPNRGWPPPPRATPVIVPPHLRKTEAPSTAGVHTAADSNTNPGHQGAPTTTKGKGRSKNSSLHKAVMERLEIQNAMNEMGTHK